MSESDSTPDLAETLRRYVTAWIDRVAPRIRDEMALAKLEIVLSQPQGEEDGTLYLEFAIDETVTSDRSGGRVTGQRFDPLPPPVHPPDITHCAIAGCRAKCMTADLDAEGWLRTPSGPLCTGCQPL